MALPEVSPPADQEILKLLTNREAAVLRLVGEGLSAKQIGEILKISRKTVEFHKRHIFERLGLTSSLQLVRVAVETGLVLRHRHNLADHAKV
jgi:DNA-binding NarL/FixJ family response regulator